MHPGSAPVPSKEGKTFNVQRPTSNVQGRESGAIASLNRATVNDARLAGAWTLLTSVYLRRAATSADPAKAEADYLSAVRAGEGLIKLRTDAEAVTLFGQALIGSKQYARAASALERATAAPEATGVTFYLLGVAHSRANTFPKAIAAFTSHFADPSRRVKRR